jgi:hypothetical protein
VFRGVFLEMAAAFAAWSAGSLPLIFLCPDIHSICTAQVGLASWILPITSKVSLIICILSRITL